MIQLNELRIGNLIYIHNRAEQLNAYRLSKMLDGACFDESPIPVTEFWLLKFGYEKQPQPIINEGMGFHGAIEYRDKNFNAVLFHENKFWYVLSQSDNDFGIDYTCKQIVYVHKFQNLFFELEDIELPKL